MMKSKFTPSEQRPLVKDANGEPPSRMFIYSSVVDMLLYISGHICLDTSFAVSYCAKYNFSRKRSHELALNMLARYLKNTQNRGLVLDLNSDISRFMHTLMLNFQ